MRNAKREASTRYKQKNCTGSGKATASGQANSALQEGALVGRGMVRACSGSIEYRLGAA